MQTPDDINKREAVKGLINIALMEGALLIAVVGVYLATSNIAYLVGGVVGTSLIFGPMFLRWSRAHGAALKAKPNSVEAQNNG